MKITFKLSRYISFVVTMLACVASVVMMVKFFDFPVNTVLSYLFVCVVLLLSLMVVSACLAWIIRMVKNMLKRREDIILASLDDIERSAAND